MYSKYKMMIGHFMRKTILLKNPDDPASQLGYGYLVGPCPSLHLIWYKNVLRGHILLDAEKQRIHLTSL